MVPSSGTIVQVTSFFEIQFLEIQLFEIKFFEIQFFEIQFFEKTTKNHEQTLKNHEKQWKTHLCIECPESSLEDPAAPKTILGGPQLGPPCSPFFQ